MDEVAAHGTLNPFWTFGGGTVLMLHHRHRVSKDIDVFVPDRESQIITIPKQANRGTPVPSLCREHDMSTALAPLP